MSRATHLLRDLNPEQRRAVETLEGPVLVLAGAGTGKTRVITRRIAHLLGAGVPPESVLAMTFTNKAATEMRERVAALVGSRRAEAVTVGTFHAFCARVLRRHGEAVGIRPDFAICDDADQIGTARKVLRDLRVQEASLQPRQLLSLVSRMKNGLVSCDEALDAAGDDRDTLVAHAWRRYDEHLRRSRSLDFDDLLIETVRLLRERKVAEELRGRFRYLLVDEYQDTNRPQFEIVRLLAGGHRNLCVVGDDDQSIYGWRGADVSNILQFERHFRGAAVVRLTTNYRSTAEILDAANRVIRNNPARHEKSLVSALGSGSPIAVEVREDEESEATAIVQAILFAAEPSRLRLRMQGAPGAGATPARLSDFAVLFRTAVQARPFEAALRARAIPYVLSGGMSFFDRKEVRDLLAFLRLVHNPDDEMSLLRVVNTPPRGVGKSTLDRVLAHATERGVTVNAAFEGTAEELGVPETAVHAVRSLREALTAIGERCPGRKLVELVRAVIEAVDYRAEIDRAYPEASERESRWAAVQEVVNFAENHVRRAAKPSLEAFLEELTLTATEDRDADEPRQKDAVTLMTLHAAKGLEFPHVFLVGVEEGLLPHARAVVENTVEEERRLMYVGITRAQRRLVISHCAARAKYGRRAVCMPSRFLFEMEGRAPPPGWRAAGTSEPAGAQPDGDRARRKETRPALRTRPQRPGRARPAATGQGAGDRDGP